VQIIKQRKSLKYYTISIIYFGQLCLLHVQTLNTTTITSCVFHLSAIYKWAPIIICLQVQDTLRTGKSLISSLEGQNEEPCWEIDSRWQLRFHFLSDTHICMSSKSKWGSKVGRLHRRAASCSTSASYHHTTKTICYWRILQLKLALESFHWGC
jgi:hypothetical protein